MSTCPTQLSLFIQTLHINPEIHILFLNAIRIYTVFSALLFLSLSLFTTFFIFTIFHLMIFRLKIVFFFFRIFFSFHYILHISASFAIILFLTWSAFYFFLIIIIISQKIHLSDLSFVHIRRLPNLARSQHRYPRMPIITTKKHVESFCKLVSHSIHPG